FTASLDREKRGLFGRAGWVLLAKGIACHQTIAWRIQEDRRRAAKICAGVSPDKRSSRRRDQFKRHAISGRRLCRCDWPLERQRVSRRDEETQLSRTRRGARVEDTPAHRRCGQSIYAGTHLEKYGDAGASGGRACDRAESSGHAS